MAYKEFYHPNMAGTAMQRQMKHTGQFKQYHRSIIITYSESVDHCIEYLRETLTCKPDISLVTFRWINNTAQHPEDPGGFYPTNFDSAQHECMDWKLLNSWAEKRSYNLYNLQALDRPE